MKISMKRTYLFFLLAAISIIACTKETVATSVDCGTTAVTYEGNVKNIIQASCATAGCHDATTRADGKNYSTYALVASEANKAAFLGSINQLSSYKSMPQGSSKLSDAQIKILTCWVNGGKVEK